MRFPTGSAIAADAVAGNDKLRRGQVWCRKCGATRKVNSADAIASKGWPKCCGHTMTIDSPDERRDG